MSLQRKSTSDTKHPIICVPLLLLMFCKCQSIGGARSGALMSVNTGSLSSFSNSSVPRINPASSSRGTQHPLSFTLASSMLPFDSGGQTTEQSRSSKSNMAGSNGVFNDDRLNANLILIQNRANHDINISHLIARDSSNVGRGNLTIGTAINAGDRIGSNRERNKSRDILGSGLSENSRHHITAGSVLNIVDTKNKEDGSSINSRPGGFSGKSNGINEGILSSSLVGGSNNRAADGVLGRIATTVSSSKSSDAGRIEHQNLNSGDLSQFPNLKFRAPWLSGSSDLAIRDQTVSSSRSVPRLISSKTSKGKIHSSSIIQASANLANLPRATTDQNQGIRINDGVLNSGFDPSALTNGGPSVGGSQINSGLEKPSISEIPKQSSITEAGSSSMAGPGSVNERSRSRSRHLEQSRGFSSVLRPARSTHQENGHSPIRNNIITINNNSIRNSRGKNALEVRMAVTDKTTRKSLLNKEKANSNLFPKSPNKSAMGDKRKSSFRNVQTNVRHDLWGNSKIQTVVEKTGSNPTPGIRRPDTITENNRRRRVDEQSNDGQTGFKQSSVNSRTLFKLNGRLRNLPRSADISRVNGRSVIVKRQTRMTQASEPSNRLHQNDTQSFQLQEKGKLLEKLSPTVFNLDTSKREPFKKPENKRPNPFIRPSMPSTIAIPLTKHPQALSHRIRRAVPNQADVWRPPVFQSRDNRLPSMNILRRNSSTEQQMKRESPRFTFHNEGTLSFRNILEKVISQRHVMSVHKEMFAGQSQQQDSGVKASQQPVKDETLNQKRNDHLAKAGQTQSENVTSLPLVLPIPPDCALEPFPADKRYYMQFIPGHGLLPRPCSMGTIYNHTQCRCVTGFTKVKTCEPELYLSFKDDIRDKSRHRLPLGVSNVQFQKGAGAFNSTSQIISWRFTGARIGNKLTVRVSFKDVGTKNDSLEYLVTNCKPTAPTELGSVMIGLDRNASEVVLLANTYQSNDKIHRLKYQYNEWQDLIFSYDGEMFRGQIGSKISQGTKLQGKLEQKPSGLVIGRCGEYPGFNGYMKELYIYLCNP